MEEILTQIKDIVWGIPLIVLILGTGIYFTIKLKGLQIRHLILAFKCIFSKEDNQNDSNGDVSSFGALCTALSSTIGTGNIVGVATAIIVGGPGALFWMWIAALLGMATKYAEGLLAILYRTRDDKGNYSGGPMYYLSEGLNLPFLGKIFAFFGVLVSLFGIGTFSQVKSISDGLNNAFSIDPVITAVVITVLVAIITLGGIERIAKVSESVVPFMSILYILGVIIVIATNINKLGDVIVLIVTNAFNPSSIFGSATGIGIITVIQTGITRGIFSNEAGLGSAPIAAAAAKTKSCVRQGLVSMTGTFIDTVVICTLTGLAILITNSYDLGLKGAELTSQAFNSVISFANIGSLIVNLGLVFFAFTTIIGWNYYGEKCIQYLKGTKAIKPYKLVYIICVAIGPFLSLDTIFILADIVNGCMVLPNLVGLIGLRKVVIEQTKLYFNRPHKMKEKTT